MRSCNQGLSGLKLLPFKIGDTKLVAWNCARDILATVTNRQAMGCTRTLSKTLSKPTIAKLFSAEVLTHNNQTVCVKQIISWQELDDWVQGLTFLRSMRLQWEFKGICEWQYNRNVYNHHIWGVTQHILKRPPKSRETFGCDGMIYFRQCILQ